MSRIPNSINVGSQITPNFYDDTFALFDPIYGIGGLREVSNIVDRNNISAERLRIGMLVYVTSENQYYRLVSFSENPSPPYNTLTSWEIVQFLTTSNQNISGSKNFVNNINVSGTGIFNALDLNNIDNLTLSGVDVTITSGTVNLTNRPTVNGTGVLLSGEAAQVDLSSTIRTTGNQNISGQKRFLDQDLTITQFNYNNKYANVVLAQGKDTPNLITFKPVNDTGSWTYLKPNYYFSGINYSTGLVRIFFDTGESKWLYYNGGSTPQYLVAKSPKVEVEGFEAKFPLNGWTNQLNNITDLKFSPQIRHAESHASGERDALDPISIGAVALTGNQRIFGEKTFDKVIANEAVFNSIDFSDIDNVYVSGAKIKVDYTNQIFLEISETGINSNLKLNLGKNNIDLGEGNVILYNSNNIINTGNVDSSIIFGSSNEIQQVSGRRNNLYAGKGNTIISGEDNIIIGGETNSIEGINTIILGGFQNNSFGSCQKVFTDFGFASGDFASLIGGKSNSILGGEYNAVFGGNGNLIYESAPTGLNTIINSWFSHIDSLSRTNLIINGAFQTASGDYNTVINGHTNGAIGRYNNILNGRNNRIEGQNSTIINGTGNSVYAENSTVLHGSSNTSFQKNSFIIGSKNFIDHSGAAIISDSTNRVKNTETENSLSLDFVNGVYINNDAFVNNLQLRNGKFTHYSYKTSDFTFSKYMNIVNSSSTVYGVLPAVEKNKNFFVKNINSGVLHITSMDYIDGSDAIILHKNESAEFLGIVEPTYVGWTIVGGAQGAI